jgi:hypothetical protein
VTLAYGATLNERADLRADVDAELLAHFRFENFDEPLFDQVVDEDRVGRDSAGAVVGELEGCDPGSR